MTSDEAITVAIVDRPLSGFYRVLNTEGHVMAPYHMGLWAWLRLGDSDQWIRLFSILGGAVAICTLFILGARWVGRRVALVVCIAVLANPFFQRYLVDARTYSWLMALSLAFVVAVDNLLRRERTTDIVWVGVAAGIGMASHAAFSVVIGAVAMALVISRSLTRRLVRSLAISSAIAAVLWLPALFVLVTRPTGESFQAPATPGRFVAITSSALGSLPTSAILVFGILILLALTIVHSVRDWATVCTLAVSVLPPLLLAAISLVSADIFISRYLITFLPFAMLAAVMGYSLLWKSQNRAPVLAAIAGGLIIAGILGPSIGDASQADPDDAADFLRANVRGSDVVVFDPPYVRTYVARYWGYHPESDPMLQEVDESELYPRTRSLGEVTTELDAAESIWLVTLGSGSKIRSQVQGDRSASTNTFGDLQVVELASTQR